MLISSALEVIGKISLQADLHEVKGKEVEKRSFPKGSKTWAQISDNSTNKGVEENVLVGNGQDKELKERQGRATNVIIKGVKEFGRDEHTLVLASDFVRDMGVWQGQIYQAWRVGKICEERT